MKKTYIKPCIICTYGIDISIIAATVADHNGKVDDSDATLEKPDADGSGGGILPPIDTKGTSWNLWDDEEDYY